MLFFFVYALFYAAGVDPAWFAPISIDMDIDFTYAHKKLWTFRTNIRPDSSKIEIKNLELSDWTFIKSQFWLESNVISFSLVYCCFFFVFVL